jgi:hypothetical protein
MANVKPVLAPVGVPVLVLGLSSDIVLFKRPVTPQRAIREKMS